MCTVIHDMQNVDVHFVTFSKKISHSFMLTKEYHNSVP